MQAVYIEAVGMVEEYQQALSVANLGGIRDVQGHYPQIGLKNPPQVPHFCTVTNYIARKMLVDHSKVD